MIIYKAPDEFLLKFYQWACADYRREIEEGFPLLRGIENRTTYGLLGLMQSLPKAKQAALASGLLKRFHTRAVEILGQKILPQEQQLIEQWQKCFGVINHLEQKRMAAARNLGPSLDRKERMKILGHIRKELHEPYCVWPDSGPWQGMSFDVEKGGFRIVTRFYTGMHVSLCYDHAIKNKEMGYYYNENMTFYCDKISIYSWMGISWQTMWMDLKVGDIERVAGEIVRLCRHFIEGVGGLLDDLYLA